MTLKNRSYLSAAVAAAVMTMGAPMQVGAINLSQDNIGDMAIGEYYTVRDGWQTEFSLINTSDSTVAVKIRFHEGRNSREALDFIAVLSPYDMLQGIAREDENGNPRLYFPERSETTCVVPIPAGRTAAIPSGGSLPFSANAYTGPNDDNYKGINTIDRAKEGYFTVMMMGAADPLSVYDDTQIVPYNSFHVRKVINGQTLDVPRSCALVENAFRNDAVIGGVPTDRVTRTYREFDRNVNALKLNYSLTNIARGVQGNSTATTIANFATDESFIAHTRTSIRADGPLAMPRNLIHAQSRLDERYPNLNQGDFFATWLVDSNYKHPLTFADQNEAEGPGIIPAPFNRYWAGIYSRPVDALTALLMKSSALNEWAENPFTGATTDLVLTAPTKGWYTDWAWNYNPQEGGTPHLAGISPVAALAFVNTNFGIPPFSQQFRTTGQSCDVVGLSLYNRDEVGLEDPVNPSPSARLNLCWETNVVYTGATSLLNSKQAQRAPVDAIATADPNGKINGWLQVHMDVAVTQYHPAIPLLNITYPFFEDVLNADFARVVQLGMPYIGFGYKQRDLGQGASYGGMSNHSYLRNWAGRNQIGGTLTLTDLIDLVNPPVMP